MLAVIRWTLSVLTEEKFGLKPYNPILGEIYRGIVLSEDAGPTVMLTEQVSVSLSFYLSVPLSLFVSLSLCVAACLRSMSY